MPKLKLKSKKSKHICIENKKKHCHHKKKKGATGPTGPTGPTGLTGPTGPTGPIGPVSTLPFVRVGAAPIVPNNTRTTVTDYTLITDGGLGAYFNTATGFFTALTSGLYQFSGHVLFQRD